MSTTRTENTIRTKLVDKFGLADAGASLFANRAVEKVGALTKIVLNVARSGPRTVTVSGVKGDRNVKVTVRECDDGVMRSVIYLDGKRVSEKTFDLSFPKK